MFNSCAFKLVLMATTILLISSINSIAQDGSLDQTFGVGGKVTTRVASYQAEAQSLVVQKDGKIVVVGYRENLDNDIVIVRYNENGSLDTTFDHDGIVTTTVFRYQYCKAYSIVLQTDGKLLVSGFSSFGNNLIIVLLRYNINGSLDTSFNHSGIVTLAIGSYSTHIYSMALQRDGKIVVTGDTHTSINDMDVLVVRFNIDGTLDKSFDTDGIVITDIGNFIDICHSIVIQEDGKILVAANKFADLNVSLIVMLRYNSNGSLDTTFDHDGMLNTNIGFGGIPWTPSNITMVQNDQKIILLGKREIGNDAYNLLVRYHANGSIDSTFGVDGYVVSAVRETGYRENFYALNLQRDGKILAVGRRIVDTIGFFLIIRYNKNGSIDESFGEEGKAITNFGNAYELVRAAAIQNDDKIILVGSIFEGNDHFALARFNNTITGTINVGDKDNMFNIFPNPIHTFASIHINSSLNSGTLCIYNMLGNKMRTIEHIFGQTITIQREQLAAGFYLIQLTEGARVIGEKIIEIVD